MRLRLCARSELPEALVTSADGWASLRVDDAAPLGGRPDDDRYVAPQNYRLAGLQGAMRAHTNVAWRVCVVRCRERFSRLRSGCISPVDSLSCLYEVEYQVEQ